MADDAVAGAMRAVPRTGFLPRSQRSFAGADHPLPIGQGQTSSQPSTVAAMLRLLRVPRRARILDVGAGSGWTTALLAHLTGPDGEVLGVERHARLAEWGAANVAATGMGWARVEQAETDALGAPRTGGWDRILVSATADRLPPELVDQLAPGGLMVIPVRGRMLLVERHADGDVHVSEHGAYRFVPLVEG
ncbi:protein-L-isoaspartate O-methyltransferase family protein [Myceligenerans salitolerans]|uniref:Protein-L-isoaspartate O-methyltransferase n=1 Tax=Myceligenerans salitolerans TaxID=1230528 RepID=A0ABS3I3U8_9MICO|nr:protein-L-isoaspartate O-methyltransferase [Myceligenerans salitolerans]MBO0607657.1 protein-L-isoaspartate carboxylmethyltransferase [Myceligenerans salitolerans]